MSLVGSDVVAFDGVTLELFVSFVHTIVAFSPALSSRIVVGTVVLRRGVDEVLRGVDEVLSGVEEVLRGVDEVLSGVEEMLRGVDEVLSGVDEVLRGVKVTLGPFVDATVYKEERSMIAKTFVFMIQTKKSHLQKKASNKYSMMGEKMSTGLWKLGFRRGFDKGKGSLCASGHMFLVVDAV